MRGGVGRERERAQVCRAQGYRIKATPLQPTSNPHPTGIPSLRLFTRSKHKTWNVTSFWDTPMRRRTKHTPGTRQRGIGTKTGMQLESTSP